MGYFTGNVLTDTLCFANNSQHRAEIRPTGRGQERLRQRKADPSLQGEWAGGGGGCGE